MSITIFHPEIKDEDFIADDCMCVLMGQSKPMPGCPHCKGTGTVLEVINHLEVNMTNSNFKTLWSALGLEFDYCGSIHAKELLVAINRYIPGLAHRETVENGLGIWCGADEDYIQRKLTSLRVLAERCEGSEKSLCWG